MKRTTLLLLVLSIAIVAVMLPSFGKKRTALWLSDFPDKASYQFPLGFLWGAASAAQHVESQQFLVSHLREVWNAINHGGADIRGYMHWSFNDNFEWAEGFTARFGLVKVDYDNNFQRIPKPSADIYTQIIQSNAISDELMQRHAEK